MYTPMIQQQLPATKVNKSKSRNKKTNPPQANRSRKRLSLNRSFRFGSREKQDGSARDSAEIWSQNTVSDVTTLSSSQNAPSVVITRAVAADAPLIANESSIAEQQYGREDEEYYDEDEMEQEWEQANNNIEEEAEQDDEHHAEGDENHDALQDSSRVSISNFPIPPKTRTGRVPSECPPISESTLVSDYTVSPLRISSIATTDSNISLFNKKGSFAIKSIDLLMNANPNLRAELSLIKKTVKDHEKEVMFARDELVDGTQKELWESMVKVAKLEENLSRKDELIEETYEKITNLEDELDTREREIQKVSAQVKKLRTEVAVRQNKAAKIRAESGDAISKVEYEKKELMERIRILEEQLETEKMKFDNVAEAKELAEKHNDGVKKHYAFYRNYYHHQHNLYQSYFGRYGKEKGITPNEVGMGAHLRLKAITEDADNETDGHDPKIRNITEALRIHYRKNLEGDEANEPESPSPGKDLLRGFELLGLVDQQEMDAFISPRSSSLKVFPTISKQNGTPTKSGECYGGKENRVMNGSPASV